MTYQKRRAEQWAELELGDGHQAYALRQADIWRRVGSDAAARFNKVREGPRQEGESDPVPQASVDVISGNDDAGEMTAEFDLNEAIE